MSVLYIDNQYRFPILDPSFMIHQAGGIEEDVVHRNKVDWLEGRDAYIGNFM